MSDYIGATPSYGVFDRQVILGNGTATTFNLDFMKKCLILTPNF